jgi:hypothetical protein
MTGSSLWAQEVISAAGGHSSGTKVQASWTVGEPVIETQMNGQYILTQGMHQGNLVVTVAREIAGLDYQVTAYPNPVSKYVKLDIGAPRIDGFSYALYNAEGQLLKQEEVNQKVTTIPMEEYTHASYLLRVMSKGKEIKVFRVIKNKQ